MEQPYTALADLVGQLLAQRWIQEHEQENRDKRPKAQRPQRHTARPPSHKAGDKEKDEKFKQLAKKKKEEMLKKLKEKQGKVLEDKKELVE